VKALMTGNFQAASDAFAAALRLEKGSEKAELGHAIARAQLGFDDEATALFKNAGNISPDTPWLLIPLGAGLNAAGDHEAAVPVLLNATARFPEEPGGWNQLAAAYAGQARYEEALTCVRTSLHLSLNQSEGWGELGSILCGQGRFYEAIAAFEKSLTLDPKNDKALTGLGDTWMALGRPDDAGFSYRKAAEIMPEKKENWLRLAKFYEKTGKTAEAAEASVRGGVVSLTGNETSLNDQPGNTTAPGDTNTTVNITQIL
jgi:tetratricopeptide (TPR) repeat protein